MYNYKNSRGNLLYDTLNHVYYLLGINICFILSNLLFIIALLIVKLEFHNTFIFIISLIPTGPSITALFSVTGKFIREGDISPFKDYFKSYKLNFKESMKIWIIQLLLIVIIVIDIRYMIVSKNIILLSLFKPLLFIGGIIFSISIYLYAILSRFELKTRDLIKISIIYTFKKLPLSIINIFLVLGLVYFASVKSQIFIPILSGIIAYLLMLGQTSTLKEIETYLITT